MGQNSEERAVPWRTQSLIAVLVGLIEIVDIRLTLLFQELVDLPVPYSVFYKSVTRPPASRRIHP